MATAPLNRILGHLRVSLADAPDADLLRAFLASRDSTAFAAIVRRHGPTVLNACRQVLRQESDVEDAFQATFLVLFKSGHRIKSGQSLGSWLFGVAHRVAVNARCRRTKLESRERTNEEPPHPAAEPPDLSWREASAILHEELNRLPDKLRLPLLLCYLEGKSRDEAAAELGWSAGVVKGCARARPVAASPSPGATGHRAVGRAARGGRCVPAAAAAPPAWVDSVVSFAAAGPIRPAVSALARGVFPVIPTIRRWATALSVAVLVGVGTMIAASKVARRPAEERRRRPQSPRTRPKPPPARETGRLRQSRRTPTASRSPEPSCTSPSAANAADVATTTSARRKLARRPRTGRTRSKSKKTEITRYLMVGADGHAVGWANLENATGHP